jgi:hypothetical protein
MVQRTLLQKCAHISDQWSDRHYRVPQLVGWTSDFPHPVAQFGGRINVDARRVGRALQRRIIVHQRSRRHKK